MKYKDAQQYAEDLHAFADFVAENGHKIPGLYAASDYSAYITVNDYVKLTDEEGNAILDERGIARYGNVLNEEKTRKNMRRILEIPGSWDKDWQDQHLSLTRVFGKTVRFRAYISKAATCRKVSKGKKLVKSVYIPEREEEEFEYVCDEGVSLIELSKGILTHSE